MGIKQKLGMGVMSAALGLSLVGAGTYAYFSDEVDGKATVEAGTLDLALNGDDSYTTELSDIKAPGDTNEVKLELKNKGTIDAKKLTFHSETKADEEEDKELEEHLKIKQITVNGAKESINKPISDVEGLDIPYTLKSGESIDAEIEVEFKDNNEPQNAQGGSVDIEFGVEGQQ